MLGRISYEQNGYRDYYPRTTNKITPTITTQATSTVEGRAADGSILPGWFETYCVKGSSVRTILPNGYSTCPMFYRGVTETVQAIALRELMETPIEPVAGEVLRTPWTYPYTAEEIEQMKSRPPAQIQVCPPTCPEGYSKITGKLLPGWIQPQCIRAPCPAMYVGDKETQIVDVFEMPDGLVVATDDDGDVVVAAKKKPNWLPLALAAGAAYFFMM